MRFQSGHRIKRIKGTQVQIVSNKLQGVIVSDQDWYNSQGVQFEVVHNTLNQQVSQTEQLIAKSQTVD